MDGGGGGGGGAEGWGGGVRHTPVLKPVYFLPHYQYFTVAIVSCVGELDGSLPQQLFQHTVLYMFHVRVLSMNNAFL